MYKTYRCPTCYSSLGISNEEYGEMKVLKTHPELREQGIKGILDTEEMDRLLREELVEFLVLLKSKGAAFPPHIDTIIAHFSPPTSLDTPSPDIHPSDTDTVPTLTSSD